jgi:transporter family-2 protein
MVKTINMLLSKEVGIYKSNISNHITGLFGAWLFVLVLLRGSDFELVQLTQVGIFPLLGGILGATFVALSNYTFSKTNVLTSTLLILIGQTLSSVIIDYIYLDKMVSPLALFGTVLIIIAVIVYNQDEIAH